MMLVINNNELDWKKGVYLMLILFGKLYVGEWSSYETWLR